MENNQFESQEYIDILEKIKTTEPYELALSSNDKLKKNYLLLLHNFYEKSNHYYSDISLYIYNSSEEDLDYLDTNIHIIYDYLKNNENLECYNSYKKVGKLLDHIKLERNRNITIEKKIEELYIEKLNIRTKSISDELESTIDERIKLVDKRFDKINIESITVISIFSAIIMSFFGGFSFFGEALKSINQQPLDTTLIVISFVSFAMFNIFYLLFLLIGKIINKPLVSNCENLNCDNCNFLKSFFYKHKINIFVNIIFLILFYVLTKNK